MRDVRRWQVRERDDIGSEGFVVLRHLDGNSCCVNVRSALKGDVVKLVGIMSQASPGADAELPLVGTLVLQRQG